MIEPSKDLRGPWDAPLKEYVNQFYLRVTVYDGSSETDDIVVEKIIDYGKFEDRKWLGRITFWAAREGYIIQSEAVKK